LLLSSLGSIVSSPVCTTAGAGSDATTDVAGNSTAVTAADATDTSGGADIGNGITGDRTAVGDTKEIATGLYRLLIAAAPDNITVLVDDAVGIEAAIAPLAAGGSLVAAAAGIMAAGALAAGELAAGRVLVAAGIMAAEALAAEALATGGALLELFFLRFGAFEAAMGPVVG